MKQILTLPGRYVHKQRMIAGFSVAEAIYPPRLRQTRHTHTHASFSFVLAGSYLENYEKRGETREKSTVVFHPPQESHSVDFESEAVRILNVEFDFPRLAQIREHSIVLDSSAICRTETTAWLGNRIYQEFNRTDAASALSIEGLVLEILAEASRNRVSTAERKSPRWLEQAKDFLHDNFSESFALEDVSKIAGVHPVHLARVFREQFGCTIGEYVRRLRVEFACRQISATDISLNEIAVHAGFSDQSHFTRAFKNQFGITPNEYRKIVRKS